MSIIKESMIEELERNRRAQKTFEKHLDKLLKGSLSVKKINGSEYIYITYRVQDKVITEYHGKATDKRVLEYKMIINKRKEVEKDLKKLKEQGLKLEKAIAKL